MSPHFCSTECSAAGRPCGLCIAQDQALTDSRKRGNGKPTLVHNPFLALFTAIKKCGCGRSFTAAAWKGLQYVGIQDDGVERIELRNCSRCGSTIAIELGPSAEAARP